MRLRSFKLRFVDHHVRVVLAPAATGAGVGVDLLGSEAEAAFARAAPLLLAVPSAQSGRVRTLSVDLERCRLLATFAPVPARHAVEVVRCDDAQRLAAALTAAHPLLEYLEETAQRRLAAR